MLIPIPEKIVYTVLGDDIHSLTIPDGSTYCMSMLTAMMHLLYAAEEHNNTLYVMISCKATNTTIATRVWNAIRSIHYDCAHSHMMVALVLPRSPLMLSFYNSLPSLYGKGRAHMRMFNVNERDRAVAWLLSKQLEAKAKARVAQMKLMDVR